MVSNKLFLVGIVAFATVPQTSAQFGLGNLLDSVKDNLEDFDLGDFEDAINGIFGDASGWFDTMFVEFDFDAIKGVVDTAIADASEGIQGFGETFENVFGDVTQIPEQYAYFLKDSAIDVAALASEVFSSDAIQGIPDDVAAMFENAGDDIGKSFGMMLDVPSMAEALKNAGVDIDLLTATAEIGTLFAESTKDNFLKGVDFSKANIAGIQKAVAAMGTDAQNTFKAAMKASRTGTDVALGEAWTAVLASDELKNELSANNVDITKLQTAATASTEKVEADIIGIGNLFAASSKDAFFKAVDFSNANIAGVQKAVAAMGTDAQNTFDAAMKASNSRTGNDVTLAKAWTAVLANDELKKELSANNVDTTKLQTAAAASTANAEAEIISAQGSGAATATAGAAAVALVVALAF